MAARLTLEGFKKYVERYEGEPVSPSSPGLDERLRGCKGYVHATSCEAANYHGVANFQPEIFEKILDLSLQLSLLSEKNRKPKFVSLGRRLIKHIEEMTPDQGERRKLFSYADDMMHAAADYRNLSD